MANKEDGPGMGMPLPPENRGHALTEPLPYAVTIVTGTAAGMAAIAWLALLPWFVLSRKGNRAFPGPADIFLSPDGGPLPVPRELATT